MVFELATRTNPEEFQVDVIGLVPRAGDAIKHALEQAGIPVRWIEKQDKLGLELFEDLAQEFTRTQPDIVHTHLFAADVWGTRAALRAQVGAVVSTEHSVNRNEGWLKHRLKCRARRYQQRVVAVSEAVGASIRHECPKAADKIIVISNGIDTKHFGATPRGTAPATAPVELVVVGRLEPEKGQVQLLRALAHVRAPFRLTVVGDGSQRRALEDQVQRLGWTDHIQFVGQRTDVERFYRAADMAIVPSRWEGLGLAALEAMAAGCVVVAADVDGLREIIHHGTTGLLVSFDAAQQAGEAIDALIRQPERRAALAQAGQALVREQYDVVGMVAGYEALYRSLL